jgi:hypothetical protein
MVRSISHIITTGASMHSILLLIEQPGAVTSAPMGIQRQLFYTTLPGFLGTHPDIEKITENALLILMQNGLSAFVDICRLCSDAGIPYRCIFFEEPPKWVPSKI